MDFSGKIALVTGAGSGIGRATALLLARLGAKVALLDKDEQSAADTAAMLPGEALVFGGDVGNESDVIRVIEKIDAVHSRIDVLVNNAGIGAPGTVVDLAPAMWDEIMRVNVRGVFLCSKHSIPLILRARGGAIVNTASYTAAVAIPNRAAYVASKGAIVSLTRAMALDHAHQNIRVNCVAPGTIASPWFDAQLKGNPEAEKLIAQLGARAPMNRMGTPEEVAEAIAWLASGSSSFATGSVLTVDGGSSIW